MIAGLHLTPEEWLLAPWRPRTVQPRPAERPFDRAASLKALARLRRAWGGPSESMPFDSCGIRAGLSAEEAVFWLRAAKVLAMEPGVNAGELTARAGNWRLEERPAAGELARESVARTPAFVVLLDRLHGWNAVIEWVRSGPSTPRYKGWRHRDDCFRTGLMIHLSEAELAPLREAVRERLALGDYPDFLVSIATTLGESAALSGVASNWNSPHGYQASYASLATLPPSGPMDAWGVVAWLAHTGLDRLEGLTDHLLSMPAAEAKPMAAALVERVSAPELAPCLIRLIAKNRGGDAAGQWLLADPARTRLGLGSPEFPKKERAVLQALADTWLARLDPAGAAGRPAPKRAWFSPALLPPLDGCDLEPLAATPVDPVTDTALTRELRSRYEPSRLDDFALALVNQWASGGADAGDRWALAVGGLLGGEKTAMRVLELTRGWRTRMTVLKLAYRVLERIHTPAVLWRARLMNEERFLGDVAALRGIDSGRLLDEYLPDPPAAIGWSEAAEPVLVDDRGRQQRKAPKSASDEVKAWLAEAQAIRKHAERRLEAAWMTGARWERADFERFILGHPVQRRLARLLVWGVADAKEEWGGFFRVCEDGSFADSSDQPWTWPAGFDRVGLPRPLHFFANPESQQWARLFGDYEMVPLLDQLAPARSITLPAGAGHNIVVQGTTGVMPLMRLMDRIGYSFEDDHAVRTLRPLDVTVRLKPHWHAEPFEGSLSLVSAASAPMRWDELPPEALRSVLGDLDAANLTIKETP